MNEVKKIDIEKILHDTPSIKVGYNSEISTVILVMKGFLKYDQFVAASEVLLKAIELYKPNNLLTDLRQSKVLSREIQEYNNTIIAPFLTNSSIIRNPLLVSEDIFLKFTVDTIKTKFKSDFKFEVKYFTEYEQFLEWITEAE